MVRVLRAVGRTNHSIRQSLRSYFAPPAPPPPAPHGGRPLAEQQLENQTSLINALATELVVLRTGNHAMAQYEEMIRTIGAPLVQNADDLERLERRETAVREAPAYAELRAAVLDFLEAREDADDEELIALLNEVVGDDAFGEEAAVRCTPRVRGDHSPSGSALLNDQEPPTPVTPQKARAARVAPIEDEEPPSEPERQIGPHSEPEPEPEANLDEAEAEPEPEANPDETEAEPEPNPEANLDEAEPEPEPEANPDEPEPEANAAAEAEPELERESEPAAEAAPEPSAADMSDV
jgi:hypothetical protein